MKNWFKKHFEFGIIRTTFTDRLIIFIVGMSVPAMALAMIKSGQYFNIWIPAMMTYFVLSKAFKKVGNGRNQVDGRMQYDSGSFIFDDIYPVQTTNETVAVLNKHFGLWLGKYEVEMPFFEDRVSLFWPDGTIVKTRDIYPTLKDVEFVSISEAFKRDGNKHISKIDTSLDEAVNALVIRLSPGLTIEDDEYRHKAVIPAFSSAKELDMKLGLIKTS